MVAKPYIERQPLFKSLNLAKIHMVAKLKSVSKEKNHRLNLAKIHMVAKRTKSKRRVTSSLNLAKIHMVAKH